MPHGNRLCYEFGPFRLDVGQRVLTRDGETVSVAPKASEILLLLLKNAGQLVTKEDLLKEVWPETFVEEANVTQNVYKLRQILSDERAGSRYIETVPRRGYRFVAPVITVNGEGIQTENLDSNGPDNGLAVPVLAVMPFINATGDKSIEYLADGITDRIINNLSRISKLRVMSRSAVFRYRGRDLDPREMGETLGVNVVLVGKVYAKPSGLAIGAELVDTSNGWQLWGEDFDCALRDILEIQDEIARQLSVALRLKLTGDEEKGITTRYTESSDAYEAYLEGRYYWSSYTKDGIENAIGHFRRAIDLDPNYALAYSGIVDCYLRLATNYLPPEGALVLSGSKEGAEQEWPQMNLELLERIRRRCEWDWRGAERELTRAAEMNVSQTWVHQWHSAYLWSLEFFEKSTTESMTNDDASRVTTPKRFIHLRFGLTLSEEIQISCAIARDQIQVGNYRASELMLQKWWKLGERPRLDGLSEYSAADLLFTVGTIAGCVSSTGHLRQGQRHAQALLNGSLALYEHLGATARVAESSIELARCYYHEGLFDIARNTLSRALDCLTDDQHELRGVCLVLLGGIEREAGRYRDSFRCLSEAIGTIDKTSPLVAGRYHHELATTLKEMALSSYCDKYFEDALTHFQRAIAEFEAIGNHRHAAASENNLGYLLLNLGRWDESEFHLVRAKAFFDLVGDRTRSAQVDDTLAWLYVGIEQFHLAEQTVSKAVKALEDTDEEALLAEALTTRGFALCRLNRYDEAKKSLEAAYQVATRCGDREGAGRALLVLFEEMSNHLEEGERIEISRDLKMLLATTQQASIVTRIRKALAPMV
jgi:DNA-binding winged helix-turn-helix (wHTH) protein/tetratricopeptide (TPR) repeat protein